MKRWLLAKHQSTVHIPIRLKIPVARCSAKAASDCRNQSLCDITTRWQWKTAQTVQAQPCGTRIKKIPMKAPLRSTPRHRFPSGKRSTLTFDLTFFVGNYHRIS